MASFFKNIFISFIFLALPCSGLAQKVIEGTVKKAKTGENLPAANIVIQDAYFGTVSNSNGFYRLAIPDSLLPATVKVNYIGYYSEKRLIKQASLRKQNFSLKPSVAKLQELTVTGQALDLTIMERVIRRKQQWQKKLHSYKAHAYSRQVLSNDTAIVSITESITNLYWDKDKGYKEVRKWRNQTKNLELDNNFAGVNYLPNLYDDNIEIFGYKLVGVTHPEAPKYYNFTVTDTLSMNGKAVYEIKVKPGLKLQPLFKGKVYILDKEFAMIRANLQPNDVVRIPTFINELELSYKQQFNNYGGEVWVPVNARITGTIKVDMLGLELPAIHFKQLAQISDYKINVSLPDSLFKNKDVFSIDTTGSGDSLFVQTIKRIPLSPKEKHAYTEIDSSETIEEAFKPSGFLARFIEEEGGETDTTSSDNFDIDIPGHFEPRARYNRVEGLYAGLIYDVNIVGRLKLMLEGGYGTAYENWSYGAGLEYKFNQLPFNPAIGALYRLNTTPRYSSLIYNPTITSVPNILGYENYFDYFRNEGVKFYLHLHEPETELGLKASFVSKNQTSLKTKTSYDILGRDNNTRSNPAINEGRLHALSMAVTYNQDEVYSYGVTGVKQFIVGVEISRDEWGSDFNYTRFSGNISWSFETFFQRRLFPNTLYLWLSAGTFTGHLPYQKFGAVDVAEGIISPFGALRTVRFRPYEGAQYIVLHAEHNFRTVPFEILGLDWLVQQNIGLIAFGSVAKTNISDSRRTQIMNRTGYIPFTTNGIHAEAGLSITGIFTAFRVDFAYRIDEPGLFIGIGLTRFF